MPERDHTYRGIRVFEVSVMGTRYTPGWRIEVDGAPLPTTDAPPRSSPKGWRWGYEPSSPSKLSHALLTYEFGSDVADARYSDFTHDVMAELAGSPDAAGWALTSQELHDWLNTRRLLASVLDELEKEDPETSHGDS